MKLLLAVMLLFAIPLFSQEPGSSAENPLAQLKDEVKRVLAESQLPFDEEQENAIVLMMEDRRKASEDLFGSLMDFSAGPTQGQEADRLRSAIEWMRNEFIVRLQDHLRPEQLAAWSRYQEASAQANGNQSEQQTQTQFVRINNNAFTTEFPNYGGRGGGNGREETEVIQRGGAGAFHGNAQLLLKDETLNAGKRFASNKPPYQERRTSFDVSGPTIPGYVTSSFGFNQTEAENVETIRATLPDSIFALGITRPTTNRSFNVRNTFQLSDANSIGFNVSYATDTRENQGVGGFVMPERASSYRGTDTSFEVRQFSALSPRSIFENRLTYTGSRDKTTPATEGLRINVIDAFSGGGAQSKVDNTARTYDFNNLYSHLGERLTIKAGASVVYRTNESFSENNFTGTFTFSSLEAYRDGRPVTFRKSEGNPQGNINQWETGFFLQNDFKLTPQLMFMYGIRYEDQTNLNDHDNFAPRIGFAYAVGRASVIRGGAGIFYERLPLNVVESYRRLDGKQQYEIVIDNPSYPDPFQSGSVRANTASVRVFDPNLATQYNQVALLSFERTFLTNLFVSVAYDHSRIVGRYRNRNLNAARDLTSSVPRSCTPGQSAATCQRPDPTRGNVINLESTGSTNADSLRLNFRQRFSIFNVTASYQYYKAFGDALASGSLVGGGGGGGGLGLVGGGGSDNFGFGPEALPSDNYNMTADWARFAQPVHTINGTLNSRLPLGIFLTSTLQTNSGRYYAITTGRDDNMDSSPNDRPPGVGRNAGPAMWAANVNFNISKAFFFGGRPADGGTQPNVNVFANMTNAFNRPNYNNPSGVMTSPNFGKITSAGTPREIEVGLRFQF